MVTLHISSFICYITCCWIVNFVLLGFALALNRLYLRWIGLAMVKKYCYTMFLILHLVHLRFEILTTNCSQVSSLCSFSASLYIEFQNVHGFSGYKLDLSLIMRSAIVLKFDFLSVKRKYARKPGYLFFFLKMRVKQWLTVFLVAELWTHIVIYYFTGMCVLAGCDFLPSVPGIGIVKSHALVSKYLNLDRVSAFYLLIGMVIRFNLPFTRTLNFSEKKMQIKENRLIF